MYLIINDNKYTCSRRIVSKDEIRFMTVSPAVDLDTLSGAIQTYRDDGFLLSEDSVDKYERKSMTGTLFIMTNKPVPVPEDSTRKPEYRLSVLESESLKLKERLAESDEIAIELYEANLAQEAVNAEQDEAIIEIYEAMEVLSNG